MPVRMQWTCPECGHSIERPGTWFALRARIVCESCEQAIRFGYEEKMKLLSRTAAERKNESS